MPWKAKRQLEGKRVVITGASSGIGRQLALQLAAKGCRLILNARRRQKLDELVGELNKAENSENGNSNPAVRFACVIGDICKSDVRQSILDSAHEHFGGLDILINNAGIGALGPFVNADEQRLRQVMEVNFFAPAELTRLALPVLEQGEQPAIVNIGSILGHRAVPMKSEYCASKFALHGLSDSLRCELEGTAIDIVLVSPSTTSSDFFDNVIDKSSGDYRPMSRAQSPEYVAARTIKAIERGSHEVILSWTGWGLVVLDRWMPRFAHKMIKRFG